MLVATQNSMALDYRALSNAGLWLLGRLQTDADRARVVEGMAGSDAWSTSITFTHQRQLDLPIDLLG